MTIHALDPDVERRVRQKAREEHKSLNETLKELLAEAVGVRPAQARRRHDFSEFRGVWTEEDAGNFEEATGDTRKVDPRDWTGVRFF